jgi:hypothetical protein
MEPHFVKNGRRRQHLDGTHARRCHRLMAIAQDSVVKEDLFRAHVRSDICSRRL